MRYALAYGTSHFTPNESNNKYNKIWLIFIFRFASLWQNYLNKIFALNMNFNFSSFIRKWMLPVLCVSVCECGCCLSTAYYFTRWNGNSKLYFTLSFSTIRPSQSLMHTNVLLQPHTMLSFNRVALSVVIVTSCRVRGGLRQKLKKSFFFVFSCSFRLFYCSFAVAFVEEQWLGE